MVGGYNGYGSSAHQLQPTAQEMVHPNPAQGKKARAPTCVETSLYPVEVEGKGRVLLDGGAGEGVRVPQEAAILYDWQEIRDAEERNGSGVEQVLAVERHGPCERKQSFHVREGAYLKKSFLGAFRRTNVTSRMQRKMTIGCSALVDSWTRTVTRTPGAPDDDKCEDMLQRESDLIGSLPPRKPGVVRS